LCAATSFDEAAGVSGGDCVAVVRVDLGFGMPKFLSILLKYSSEGESGVSPGRGFYDISRNEVGRIIPSSEIILAPSSSWSFVMTANTLETRRYGAKACPLANHSQVGGLEIFCNFLFRVIRIRYDAAERSIIFVKAHCGGARV
jgi:hypothetical protein